MIQVDGLTKRYRQVVAVDGLSFTAEPGRVTGFLGPNGAGKTTTLRVIVGLVRPTEGGATVLGRPFRELEEPARTLGAVLETSAFHPGRTGRNHLRVVARSARLPESRVDEVLRLVELEEAAHRRVGGYSLGMRQRLGLAASLLGEPRVLVLDEPGNGLDPQGIRWLRGLLRARADAGSTVLVSSHLLAEVSQLADDVVIIDRGRLVRQAAVGEIVGGAQVRTRVRTPDGERLRRALAEARLAVETPAPDRLTVAAPPERVGELAARAGVVLHELVAEQATLEDAFLELLGGEGA